MWTVGVSFRRPQHKFFTACGTPLTPNEQAQERQGRSLSQSCFLLGLSCAEFQGLTVAPWNEARLCGLLKEIPTVLVALFHDAKLIPFFQEWLEEAR